MRNCLLLSEENCKLIKWNIKKCNLFRSIENVWHWAQSKFCLGSPFWKTWGSGNSIPLHFQLGFTQLFYYNADSFENFMKVTLRMAASYRRVNEPWSRS